MAHQDSLQPPDFRRQILCPQTEENDAAVGHVLPEDKFSEVSVVRDQDTLLSPGDLKHFVIFEGPWVVTNDRRDIVPQRLDMSGQWCIGAFVEQEPHSGAVCRLSGNCERVHVFPLYKGLSVLDTGLHIFYCQPWVRGEQGLWVEILGESLEHELDRDSSTLDDRFAAKDLRIYNNSILVLPVHAAMSPRVREPDTTTITGGAEQRASSADSPAELSSHPQGHLTSLFRAKIGLQGIGLQS